jgi:hypothetical protein
MRAEANLPTSNNFHHDRYRSLLDDAGLPNETKTLQKNGRATPFRLWHVRR